MDTQIRNYGQGAEVKDEYNGDNVKLYLGEDAELIVMAVNEKGSQVMSFPSELTFRIADFLQKVGFFDVCGGCCETIVEEDDE